MVEFARAMLHIIHMPRGATTSVLAGEALVSTAGAVHRAAAAMVAWANADRCRARVVRRLLASARWEART